jgi:hypothetical protein
MSVQDGRPSGTQYAPFRSTAVTGPSGGAAFDASS